MDKLRTIALLALIIIMTPSDAGAGAVEDYCRAAGWKLTHGVLSILYSPVDLVATPVVMAANWDVDGRSAFGFAFGVPFGLMNASLRQDHGMAEIFSFPFVSVSKPRPFKFEPFLTGWRPILGGTASSTIPDANAPVRRGRPSGD